MESVEVRLARLEERMVSLCGDMKSAKGTIEKIWDKVGDQSEKHHGLSGKVIGLLMTCSIVMPVIVTMLIKVVGH